MNTIGRALVLVACLFAPAGVGGCTFGVFPRDTHDPALGAVPPCFANAICSVPYDGFGFGWTRDAMRSAIGR